MSLVMKCCLMFGATTNAMQTLLTVTYILENIEENFVSKEQKITISKKENQFIAYVNKHLRKCNRMLERFKRNHSLWLAS